MSLVGVRHRVSFSVLRLGIFGIGSNLIYWHDDRAFTTEFEYSAEFPEFERSVAADDPVRLVGIESCIPALSMEEVWGGIGVLVSKTGGTRDRKRVAVIPYTPRAVALMLCQRSNSVRTELFEESA